MADTPLRTGTVDFMAGLDPLGVYGRAEASARLSQDWGAFAYGEWRPTQYGAGLGLRYQWQW